MIMNCLFSLKLCLSHFQTPCCFILWSYFLILIVRNLKEFISSSNLTCIWSWHKQAFSFGIKIVCYAFIQQSSFCVTQLSKTQCCLHMQIFFPFPFWLNNLLLLLQDVKAFKCCVNVRTRFDFSHWPVCWFAWLVIHGKEPLGALNMALLQKP